MIQKKIAIIGCNSFLAQHIIKELKKEPYELYLFGRRKPDDTLFFKFFDYPVQPIDFQELLSLDVIIYTAGAGIQASVPVSSQSIYELNTFLPVQLILYLQQNNFSGQVITFGSYFELGNDAVEKFYAEEEFIFHNNKLVNDYSISKRLLTQFIYHKLDQFNFKLIHLILPNIYGAGENKNRLIPYLVQALRSNAPINLSSGIQKRQYVHVSDVATFIERIAGTEVSGIYNITNMELLTVKDLVYTIIEKSGLKEREINFGAITKKDSEMKCLALHSGKAEKELNWKPAVSLAEGVTGYFEAV